MSFDRIIFNINLTKETVSIPLEQGNVFRQGKFDYYMEFVESQSLWNRAMSFDRSKLIIKITRNWSQSLWNRAMSFDNKFTRYFFYFHSLNPFGTGQCLSTSSHGSIRRSSTVSIPLEQGNVFRLLFIRCRLVYRSLNPFGTGQCLSTTFSDKEKATLKSQSLWNRAMSFDEMNRIKHEIEMVSIPLEQGNVFRRNIFRCSFAMLNVSIPLEQGNVFRH